MFSFHISIIPLRVPTAALIIFFPFQFWFIWCRVFHILSLDRNYFVIFLPFAEVTSVLHWHEPYIDKEVEIIRNLFQIHHEYYFVDPFFLRCFPIVGKSWKCACTIFTSPEHRISHIPRDFVLARWTKESEGARESDRKMHAFKRKGA